MISYLFDEEYQRKTAGKNNLPKTAFSARYRKDNRNRKHRTGVYFPAVFLWYKTVYFIMSARCAGDVRPTAFMPSMISLAA